MVIKRLNFDKLMIKNSPKMAKKFQTDRIPSKLDTNLSSLLLKMSHVPLGKEELNEYKSNYCQTDRTSKSKAVSNYTMNSSRVIGNELELIEEILDRNVKIIKN